MNAQRRETILSAGPVRTWVWVLAAMVMMSALMFPVAPAAADSSEVPAELLKPWRKSGTFTILVLPANESVEDPVDEYEEEIWIVESPPLDLVEDPVDEYEEEIRTAESRPFVDKVEDPVDEYEKEVHWNFPGSNTVEDPVDEYEEEVQIVIIPLPYGPGDAKALALSELRILVSSVPGSSGETLEKYGGFGPRGQVDLRLRGPVMLAVTRSLFKNGHPVGSTFTLVEDVRAGSYTFLLEQGGEGSSGVKVGSVDVTVAFHGF